MENWVSLWSVIGLAKFGWFIGMKHFLQLCILYLYCLPLPVSKFQSPFYLLNKQYPDYSCLRVFGQRCFPLLPMTQHHKLDQSHYLVYFCDIMIGTKATSSCISSNFAESSSLTYSVVFDEKLFPFPHGKQILTHFFYQLINPHPLVPPLQRLHLYSTFHATSLQKM